MTEPLGKADLLQFDQGLEARLRDHVPDVEQGLFADDGERFVKFNATHIDIQRSVETLAERELGVVKDANI